MAHIRNSISMTDRMTPTLRAIMKSMDSTLRVMQNLDKAANKGAQSKAYKQAEKDIQRANNALKKMGNYADMANRAALSGEKAYRRMGNAVGDASSKMRSLSASSNQFLTSLASGVYLAQKLANAVGGVMNTADTSRSQVARLGLYNTSAFTNEQLYGQVFATAMSTRSDLTDTADLANKILISGVYKGANASLAAIGTAGIINKALVAGGGTTEENQRALRQLTQGLASGVLQGDELRSIREQTPYFAQILAEGLSKVDDKFKGIGIGDLKQLGAEGELTAERITKAMWAMQDEINEDFKAMPKTFGQAMTSLNNIWQYFLWMLSDVDGPLGKINSRLWTFVDYLQSAEGLELLEAAAIGFNIIASGVALAMDSVGKFVVFLQENSAIAQAAFIAMGVAAVSSGIATAAAWIAATWPIILVIGLVGLVSWAFLRAGYTAQQVVGAIVGVVLWLVAAIWDAVVIILDLVMWVVGLVIMGVIGLGAGVTLVVMGIVQIIIWAVMAIITAFWFVLTVIESVFLFGKAAVQVFAIGVASMFLALGETVAGIMWGIAKCIDAVFGSNLADSVYGWSAKLEGDYVAFVEENDPSKTMDEIGKAWEEFGAGVENMFTSDDFNLYGEMGNVVGGADYLMNGTAGLLGAGDSFLQGMMVNPNEWYGAGSEWGAGLVDEIGSMNLGLPTSSVLDAFNADGVEVSGGYLDGIKSDVNISDEDVQLMRDMAARDFLLQLQAITPVANVTFGDVRETADVNKILDVIEQMVDEQMATALVS